MFIASGRSRDVLAPFRSEISPVQHLAPMERRGLTELKAINISLPGAKTSSTIVARPFVWGRQDIYGICSPEGLQVISITR